MSYDLFPQQLREQKQWVVWKYEMRDGRKTKVPFQNTAQYAKSNLPETWNTFDNILKFLETDQFNGIGYVFKAGVVGIDLDHCFEEDGFTLKKWAKDIVDLFPSYIEISPSGTGLHIFLLCDIDFKGAKVYVFPEDETKQDAIERYVKGRFFTVTGNTYGDYNKLKTFEPEVFLKWHNGWIKEKENTFADQTYDDLVPEDKKIIEVAGKSKNGKKFSDLYAGDWEEYFRSQSEADMSLVGMLAFFCRNNPAVIDRIFRTSGLMREKWNRPDYRDEMIKKCYSKETMNWEKNNNINNPEDDVVIRRLSDVQAKNINWIIHPVLAKGKMTIFHGEPGKAKSQASIYIASEISKGGTYFDGQKIEPGEVLFITSEDEASDTLKPRLMACGANVHNIIELRWIVKKDGKIRMFNLEEHIPQLKRAVEQLPNLKLIVIDPISAFLGKVDGNSGGVRGLFAEIKPITEERGCALLVIAHHNKASNMKSLNKISGSVSFGAAARIAYLFGDNPLHAVVDDGTGKFIMAQSKNNLEKEESNSQIYDIESAEVDENGVMIKTSRVKWLGASEIKSQEIVDYMPNKKTAGRPNEKRQECIDEIINFMGEKTKLTIAETKVLRTHLLSMGFDEQMQRRSRQDIGLQSIVINNESFWEKIEKNSLFNT